MAMCRVANLQENLSKNCRSSDENLSKADLEFVEKKETILSKNFIRSYQTDSNQIKSQLKSLD